MFYCINQKSNKHLTNLRKSPSLTSQSICLDFLPPLPRPSTPHRHRRRPSPYHSPILPILQRILLPLIHLLLPHRPRPHPNEFFLLIRVLPTGEQHRDHKTLLRSLLESVVPSCVVGEGFVEDIDFLVLPFLPFSQQFFLRVDVELVFLLDVFDVFGDFAEVWG